MPERVKASSEADRVYTALRERILAGDIPHHARLHQEQLASELGVSRTPLREALGRLAADGLVELLPQRGARVADISAADMETSYGARLVIEPAAAALAAKRRPPEAIAEMRRAIANHRRDDADVQAVFAANCDFHLAVVSASENPFLLRFAEQLWVRRLGLRVYEEQRVPPEFIAADADWHERIADAIEAGDARLAEREMRRHIDGAMQLLMRNLAPENAA
jgi:DNA-binding GntR family transcriptional regulator